MLLRTFIHNFRIIIMRRFTLLLVLCLTMATLAFSQDYDRFFTSGTMRIDYYHSGTKGEESFSVDRVYEEGPWPGSRVALVDTMNLGEYVGRVFDLQTGMLIYSRGYSAMFNEWQTTDEALAGVRHTFSESFRLPFPRNPVQVTLSRRDKHMVFQQLFSFTVNPNDPAGVVREYPQRQAKVVRLLNNGAPAKKVDFVILADGYTADEMAKFEADAKKYTGALFSTSPFKERKSDFNVSLVESESGQSGIDKPDKNIWKRTALGTTYNTFGSARYILTEDNKDLRDLAALAPYDFLIILCNDDRYGGGGIYQLYSTCYTKTDKPGLEWQMDYVFVHELGHSFGGLGDEYYSSQVSYTDFYAKGVEPWEPNITALLDPAKLKWRHLVKPGTPIPTPWEKAQYDSLERERAKLDRLAPDYYEKREPLYRAGRELLEHSEYRGLVGAFEGAGYVSEGLYRPSVDCRMFSLSLVGFDPVCTEALERMIDFYTK